jgi:hypothetical protein
METKCIQTKLYAPQTSSDLIERSLLMQRLNQIRQRPLTVTGQVTDQAALMSILALLYDMQSPLLSVEYLQEK